ncbi:MAG: PEP-CTERM sorting domain-containing protein [Phycisphaerae bacterium]|nr:PEP-CTERM sorting domain-containing protein [Phycisphaerae bacterium]
MKKVLLVTLVLLLCISGWAVAAPISYEVVDNPDSQQDPFMLGWSHELGVDFPPDELITADDQMTPEISCQIQYGGGQNFLVSITNQTNMAWTNLAYVADPETTITNHDKFLVNGQQAFYIDRMGVNTPLLSESMTTNCVFEPGETWQFIIQEYVNGIGMPASALGSWNPTNGMGMVGNQSGGDQMSSGSIIAIPEPISIILIGIGGLAIRRRR